MVDFGSDFAGVDDLDANLSIVTGRTCLLQALLRRISTPRGALWYAPDYGTDIGAFVNTPTDPRVIQQAIESEILNDERVTDCRATVTLSEESDPSSGGKTMTVTLELETGEGPFEFTVSVSSLTGKILLQEVT